MKQIFHTIYILLGNSCNMNCKYCIQHPLITNPIPQNINPDIYTFLEKCSRDSLSIGDKLPLEFYGGEPLLYFDAIKQVFAHTNKFCRFSIISNGKNITDDQINTINKYNISYRMSWDGKNVDFTRGENVVNKESINRLVRIKDFGISAVISGMATPFDILKAFSEQIAKPYFYYNGKFPELNTDEILNVGNIDPAISSNIDYDRIRKEVSCIMHQEVKDVPECVYMQWRNNMINIALDTEWSPRQVYAACGNGYDTLNLDLAGNLYSCHNLSTPVATINTPYFDYLGRIIETDTTLMFKQECKKCSVFQYCGGGCKFITNSDKRNVYCKLKKAVFEPVIEYINQKIK